MKQKGLTLTELILTISILGIVFALGSQLLKHLHRLHLQLKARQEIQRDARNCLNLMNRFLREAKASSVKITRYNLLETQYSRIEFQTRDGVNYIFQKVGNELRMTSSTAGEQKLSTNLLYLAFTYPKTDNNSIISISLTMEKDTYEGGEKALHLAIEKVRIMND